MPDTRIAWDKENTVSVTLKFNKRTDADIIAALAAQPNKQKFIKDLIRKENTKGRE